MRAPSYQLLKNDNIFVHVLKTKFKNNIFFLALTLTQNTFLNILQELGHRELPVCFQIASIYNYLKTGWRFPLQHLCLLQQQGL